MNKYISLFFAALIFPGAFVLAAPEPEGTALTLPSALAAARSDNPSLAAARRQLSLLEAEIAANSAYPNPRLEVEGSASGGNAYELKAVQPVPLTRRSGTAASRATCEAAKKELEALETKVLGAARKAWYALRIAGERRNFEETNLKFAMDILNKIEMRLQTGEAGNTDLARAKVEASRSRFHLQEARTRANAAAGELNGLMGRRPDEPLEVSLNGGFNLAPVPARPGPLEEYNRLALANRAEPRALALNLKSADLSLGLEKNKRLPVPELGFIRGKDGGAGYTRLFLGLELPLWYNNKGEIKRALALRAALGYEEKRLELEIRGEVYAAWLALDLAQKRLSSAREAVTLLNDLRRAASVDYLSGKTGITAFYETNRVFLEENLNYLDALQDYYESTAQLEAAVNGGEAK